MTNPRDLVDSTFREEFHRAPEWCFRVPGRLEIFGKHTDYAGGRSLVAAVPPGFVIGASAANDTTIGVIDAVSGARFNGATSDLSCRVSARWHRYVATVVRRLSMNFPTANLSSRVVIASNLPSAAGISSSSALVIAIAEVLIARAGIEHTAEWRNAICSVEDRVAYFGCIENGASFGVLAGDEGVGTHGGSEDHAAIVMSRAGMLRQFMFSPLRCERAVRMPDGWTFVVLSSGVRASKTGRARSAYNRLAAEPAAIRAVWNRHTPDDGRSVAALAREGALSEIALEPRLAERLAHLRAEDARVADATDAFERGDIERIGDLAASSQQDAAERLGNQVPETMDLVRLARDLGARAASAFGAGWGGSVWALVQSSTAAEFLAEWRRAYTRTYERHESVGFVAPPSHGLERL